MVLLAKYGSTIPYRLLSREMKLPLTDFFGMPRGGTGLPGWAYAVGVKDETVRPKIITIERLTSRTRCSLGPATLKPK